MSEAITIGLDIAKHVFHAHGADATGRAVFSRKLTRGKLLDFFVAHPRCRVAGGLRRCASLGARAARDGARCPADPAGVREAVR